MEKGLEVPRVRLSNSGVKSRTNPEYVNGVFQTGFLYFGFGGVGNGGLERGWGGVGEGLGRGWGGGWGRVGEGLDSILQKPRWKNPVNVL